VLGPQSNAHGPNEFLHLPMGKRITCCVAQVIADHFTRNERAAASKHGAGNKSKAKGAAKSKPRPAAKSKR
jgi:hypothetical protein